MPIYPGRLIWGGKGKGKGGEDHQLRANLPSPPLFDRTEKEFCTNQSETCCNNNLRAKDRLRPFLLFFQACTKICSGNEAYPVWMDKVAQQLILFFKGTRRQKLKSLYTIYNPQSTDNACEARALECSMMHSSKRIDATSKEAHQLHHPVRGTQVLSAD